MPGGGKGDFRHGVTMIAHVSKTIGDDHPVDRLSAALARASGVLAMIGQCYDQAQGVFKVSQEFLIQALVAMEGFVDESKSAVADLTEHYDLSLQQAADTAKMAPAPRDPLRFEFKAQSSGDDVFVSRTPAAPNMPEEREPQPDTNHIAQSYDELLRKLTAAEVFAQEQQSLSMPGSQSPLVPLLRSLREDLRKVRAA